MDPHKLSCMIVCPFMDKAIGWADDSWAFRQWPLDSGSAVLEYITFRELALQRKKCLTIAQYVLERYVETGDEAERCSMTFYANLAKKMETYMSIMVSLGHAEWTSTVDESVWPEWICATRVMESLRLCSSENDYECLGACDEWVLGDEQVESGDQAGGELGLWRQRARQKVASRWYAISKACSRIGDSAGPMCQGERERPSSASLGDFTQQSMDEDLE